MGYFKRTPWTKRVANEDDRYLMSLRVWGPYRSEYRLLFDTIDNLPPLVLIGTGAGGSYIIDFYQLLLARNIQLQQPVQVCSLVYQFQ